MSKVNIPDGILPWTRSCFVCGEANAAGLKLRSRHEEGRVVIDFTPGDTERGWHEIVHGGIGMTLLDEVMTWSAILEARCSCVAADVSVRLRRPMAVGQRLRVVGWVTGGKRRLVLTAGAIYDAVSDEVMLSATGKYMPMPEQTARDCAADFVHSPEAISIETIMNA